MISQRQLPRAIRYDETLQVTRFDPPTLVDGVSVKNASAVFEIKANVQPMGAKELLLVPEMDRFKENFWLFTAGPIRVNDQVSRNNVNYTVQGPEEWGSFFKVRIVKIDVGAHVSN